MLGRFTSRVSADYSDSAFRRFGIPTIRCDEKIGRTMHIGLFVSNGIGADWAGRDPQKSWNRSLEISRLADELGFESIWVPDHLQSIREGADGPTVEAMMHLAAIAGVTRRVNLSTGVACVSFRNPALLTKMFSTLDVASGGRAEIAIGAGWNEPEWTAYGYPFPSAKERLARLRESLEVIKEMLEPGTSSYKGERYEITDLEMNPLSIRRPRMPIIVGGNGQRVTWRLAAKYADELNLDGPTLDVIPEWMSIVRDRCEEIGRDPASLNVSALIFWRGAKGPERVEALQKMSEFGLSRIHSGSEVESLDSDEPLHALIEDCKQAGVELLS
jgi:alkanesulfonate monooxygenase SsuD/methylene tetrahydromethanopterin reductase-like flavin-dependent oxidoreductase (luciferase family)